MLTDDAEAGRARLLVCIAFHFVAARLGFLFETVRTIAEYGVASVDILVITNDEGMASPVLADLCRQLSMRTVSVTPVAAGPLAHPYDLPWAHKAVLRDRFLSDPARYTHFIFSEDDLRLPFLGFCYFVAARPMLAQHGLIPAFLRFELDASRGLVTATDQREPTCLGDYPVIEAGRTLFLSAANPYCGLFVFDHALAREHVASRSFDMVESQAVVVWPVRERAAMGQCLENPPPGHFTRYMIPVDAATLVPERAALVHHLPNNYVLDTTPGPAFPFGKIRLDELIVRRA